MDRALAVMKRSSSDKWLVRTARQTVLRGRCKLVSTSMGKARCAWMGWYWKTV